jgi:hypothetical protein
VTALPAIGVRQRDGFQLPSVGAMQPPPLSVIGLGAGLGWGGCVSRCRGAVRDFGGGSSRGGDRLCGRRRGLAAEPAAAAAARQSLDDSGLLLVGEMHGARENPLLARALMRAFGITRLALEWDEDLAPVFGAFLATGTLADHWLWSGDGRITAGHLAVLATAPPPPPGGDLVRRGHRPRAGLVRSR